MFNKMQSLSHNETALQRRYLANKKGQLKCNKCTLTDYVLAKGCAQSSETLSAFLNPNVSGWNPRKPYAGYWPCNYEAAPKFLHLNAKKLYDIMYNRN